MFDCPFNRQAQRPSWQAASENLHRPDIDERFVLAVKRMKMWWRMFTPKHLDHNSKKAADRWHRMVRGEALISITESILQYDNM
jgi:hypothetical protein